MNGEWEDTHDTPTLTGLERLTPQLAPAPLVLVADDNADARDMLCELLAQLGCAVLVAADGEEAVRIASLMKPDLVVMDVSMPHMDGIQATKHLRSDPATARTPIVAVTGFGRPWEGSARRAGCNGFFEKPIDLAAFCQTLDALLPTLRRVRPRLATIPDVAP